MSQLMKLGNLGGADMKLQVRMLPLNCRLWKSLLGWSGSRIWEYQSENIKASKDVATWHCYTKRFRIHVSTACSHQYNCVPNKKNLARDKLFIKIFLKNTGILYYLFLGQGAVIVQTWLNVGTTASKISLAFSLPRKKVVLHFCSFSAWSELFSSKLA